MTMADLGPERPGQSSDTRRMSDVERITHPTRVSGRAFWVLLAVILAALLVLLAVR